MRRADRLFQLVGLLRRRRSCTAAELAERLEVSPRTVYRDIRDLSRSGVPIEGEAGVGYRLSRGFELPPLVFNADEVQALVLGARMVETWGDDDLRRAARSVLDKLDATLPEPNRALLEATALFSMSFAVKDVVRKRLRVVRRGIDERCKLAFAYRKEDEAPEARTVRPLGLYFWGRTWTLGAWCELRADYRNFRLDRMAQLELTDEPFTLEPPVTLQAYIEAMRARPSPS
jgi:predicted DNA-binding transcriptional regulator YafY